MHHKPMPTDALTAADLADAVRHLCGIAGRMGWRPIPWLVHPPALACPHLQATARHRRR